MNQIATTRYSVHVRVCGQNLLRKSRAMAYTYSYVFSLHIIIITEFI